MPGLEVRRLLKAAEEKELPLVAVELLLAPDLAYRRSSFKEPISRSRFEDFRFSSRMSFSFNSSILVSMRDYSISCSLSAYKVFNYKLASCSSLEHSSTLR